MIPCSQMISYPLKDHLDYPVEFADIFKEKDLSGLLEFTNICFSESDENNMIKITTSNKCIINHVIKNCTIHPELIAPIFIYFIFCENDDIALYEYFSDKYQFDIVKDTEYSFYPLHFACLYDHIAKTKYLVEHGADINLLSSGLTPFVIACMYRSYNVAIYLEELDVDIDIDNCCQLFINRTIMQAFYSGSVEIIRRIMCSDKFVSGFRTDTDIVNTLKLNKNLTEADITEIFNTLMDKKLIQ